MSHNILPLLISVICVAKARSWVKLQTTFKTIKK
jgi:hypothetical protein